MVAMSDLLLEAIIALIFTTVTSIAFIIASQTNFKLDVLVTWEVLACPETDGGEKDREDLHLKFLRNLKFGEAVIRYWCLVC